MANRPVLCYDVDSTQNIATGIDANSPSFENDSEVFVSAVAWRPVSELLLLFSKIYKVYLLNDSLLWISLCFHGLNLTKVKLHCSNLVESFLKRRLYKFWLPWFAKWIVKEIGLHLHLNLWSYPCSSSLFLALQYDPPYRHKSSPHPMKIASCGRSTLARCLGDDRCVLLELFVLASQVPNSWVTIWNDLLTETITTLILPLFP